MLQLFYDISYFSFLNRPEPNYLINSFAFEAESIATINFSAPIY